MSEDTQLQVFQIECIESFEMKTLYRVKALNRAHAIRAIVAGKVAYDRSDPLDDSSEFKGVVQAELLTNIPKWVEMAPTSCCGREITSAEEADILDLLMIENESP